MAKKLLKKLIDIFIDRPKIDGEISGVSAEPIPKPEPVKPYKIRDEIVNPPIEPPKPVKPPVVDK